MVVGELSALLLVVAGIGTFAALEGAATLVGVLLVHLNVSNDLERVGAHVEAVLNTVGSGALILAADGIDAVKLVGDLLAVSLLNLAGAGLVLGQGTGVSWEATSGRQVTVAVELVSVGVGLGDSA